MGKINNDDGNNSSMRQPFKNRKPFITRILDRADEIVVLDGCKVIPLAQYLTEHPYCLTKDATFSIQRWHDKLFRGFSVDLTTPFIRRIPESVGLKLEDNLSCRDAVRDIVNSTLRESKLYNENSLFRDFEEVESRKYGPMSIVLPFLHEKGLLRNVIGYFTPVSLAKAQIQMHVFDEAICRLKERIPQGSLSPDPLDLVYEESDKTTNWGSPFWLHGNDLFKGKSASELYLEIARRDLKTGKLSRYVNICVNRTVADGSMEPKQRVAWAVPHNVVLLELTIQRPVLAALSSWDEFSESVSSDSTDKVVTKMFNRCFRRGFKMIGFDASKYDQTLSEFLISAAYGIIAYWFCDSAQWLIKQLCSFMCTSDLVTPIGVFVGRVDSVASGMAATNLIDSLCQLILFEYSCLILNANRRHCSVVVNGDDGIWQIPGLTPIILSNILGPFGIVVHPDKNSFSDMMVTFCQRLYLCDYKVNGVNVGIRSAHRTVNSILNYERERGRKWDRIFDSVRCIMQLENLRHNPVHKQLVELMVRSDKIFGLGTILEGGISELFQRSGELQSVVNALVRGSWKRKSILKMFEEKWSMITVVLLSRIWRDNKRG